MVPSVLSPPLAPGLPLLGSALDIVRAPALFFVDAYRTLGPAFRVRLPTAPGGELTILAGTEANRFANREGNEIFTTRQYYHHLARETDTDNYLCTLDGEPHRHMRRTLKPGFSREAMAPFLPTMINHVRATAATWPTGTVVPVLKTLNRLTIDQLSLAAANTAMNDDVYADLDTYARTFVGAGVAMRPAILFRMPGYRRAKERFEAFLSDLIDQHRDTRPHESGRTPDLIDLLLSAVYQDGTPFDHADLVANAHLPYVNGLIYAGRICAYMLYALLNDPPLLDQLRAEVDAAFAGGDPTLEDFRKMRLLRGAIRETYRLYPIAPSVPRYAARDFEFEGYHIEAGTTVFVAMVVPHFDPDIYADPLRFDPTRFSAPRNEHRIPGAFAPYGLGAHVCLSIGTVEAVVMTTMCALLRTLEMEMSPPDYELRTRLAPVPGPDPTFSFRVIAHRAEPPASPAKDPLNLSLSAALPMLDRRQIEDLLAVAETRTFPAGEIIIREQDPADAFYIIMEGQVAVSKRDKDGQSRVVAQLDAGQYFGEIGLLHGIPRTATVHAQTSLQVIAIHREGFLKLVYEADLTSSEIAEVVRRRMVSTTLAVSLPGLTPSEIGVLAPLYDVVTYAPGERLFYQGDIADAFYIIIRGGVEVTNTHPLGEIHLAELGPGEFFGEIGLLQSRPRTATVRALPDSPLEVIALDREGFQTMLEQSEQTADQLAMTMTHRLADLLDSR